MIPWRSHFFTHRGVTIKCCCAWLFILIIKPYVFYITYAFCSLCCCSGLLFLNQNISWRSSHSHIWPQVSCIVYFCVQVRSYSFCGLQQQCVLVLTLDGKDWRSVRASELWVLLQLKETLEGSSSLQMNSSHQDESGEILYPLLHPQPDRRIWQRTDTWSIINHTTKSHLWKHHNINIICEDRTGCRISVCLLWGTFLTAQWQHKKQQLQSCHY